MNDYGYSNNMYVKKSAVDRPSKLKQHQYQDTHQQSSLHVAHHKTKSPYGQTATLQQPTTHTKPRQPVYKRPETFYDARKHINFYSRANLVNHHLNETKSTSAREARYTTYAS